MSSPQVSNDPGGHGANGANRVNLEVDPASAQVFPAIRGRQLASMGRRFCAAFVTWVLVAMPATAFLVGVFATVVGRDIAPSVGKTLTVGILLSLATLAAEVVGLALAGTTLGGWIFRVRHVNIFTGQQGGPSAVVKYLTHTFGMVLTCGLSALADLTAVRERLQRTSVDHWFRIVALAPARDTWRAAAGIESTDEADDASDAKLGIDPEDPNAQLPEIPDFDELGPDGVAADEPGGRSVTSGVVDSVTPVSSPTPGPSGASGNSASAVGGVDPSRSAGASGQVRSSTVDLRDGTRRGPSRQDRPRGSSDPAPRQDPPQGQGGQFEPRASSLDEPASVVAVTSEPAFGNSPHSVTVQTSEPSKPFVESRDGLADAPRTAVEVEVVPELDASPQDDVELSDVHVRSGLTEQAVVDVAESEHDVVTDNVEVDEDGDEASKILEVVKPAGAQVLSPTATPDIIEASASAPSASQKPAVAHQPVNSGIVAEWITQGDVRDSHAQADKMADRDDTQRQMPGAAATVATSDAETQLPAETSAEPSTDVASKTPEGDSVKPQSHIQQAQSPSTGICDAPHAENISDTSGAARPRPAVMFMNSSPKISPQGVDKGGSVECGEAAEVSGPSELTQEAGTIFESGESSPQLDKSSESSTAAEVGPSVDRDDALRSVQVSPVDLRPQKPVDSHVTTNVKEEATVVVSPDELAEAAQQQDAVITLDDGTALAVPAGVTLLGRNPAVNDEFANACVHTIKDLSYSVSKTHLALGYGDSFWIMDLGSTNGTFLLDDSGALRRLPANQRVEVTQGVSIKFGERTFSVTRS